MVIPFLTRERIRVKCDYALPGYIYHSTICGISDIWGQTGCCMQTCAHAYDRVHVRVGMSVWAIVICNVQYADAYYYYRVIILV